jgi:hypothetical protein
MAPDEDPETRNLLRTSGDAAFEHIPHCPKAGENFIAICFCAPAQDRDVVHADEH